MTDGATSLGQATLGSPGETGRPPPIAEPTALVIEGLACFDEWDTLALARLPLRDLLRKALRCRRPRELA
jgi:hypothetical protein